MKGLVAGMGLATAGVAVFGASVVGLLGVAGRLNPEGVRSVPVLNHFLKEPEAPTSDEFGPIEASAKKENAKEKEKEQGKKKRKSPIKNVQAVSADRIRKKRLFTLESFVPQTTRDEILEFYRSAEELKDQLIAKKASIKTKEFELQLRESDIEDRRGSIRKEMDNVLRKMEEVDRRIDDLKTLKARFEADITILKKSETKNIKRQAVSLALMKPQKASEVLLEFLPDKEALAVKILVSMDPEAAAKILEIMDAQRGAQLIQRAIKLIRPK
jgi:flagellar motility protein MotE (MotC chaperone)